MESSDDGPHASGDDCSQDEGQGRDVENKTHYH